MEHNSEGVSDTTEHQPASLVLAGRREANKLEKLNRIKSAARSLFVSKGFDDTTVREIASAAGVGLGTLFSYSLNKRDLLFLLGNDGLELVAREAGAALNPGSSLLDNLGAIFGAHYRFFASERVLARLVLREMAFYEEGAQACRFRQIRTQVVDHVEQALRLAMKRDEISISADLRGGADVLFAVYQVELRRWLSQPAPDLAEGLARLRHSLELCLRGVGNAPRTPQTAAD